MSPGRGIRHQALDGGFGGDDAVVDGNRAVIDADGRDRISGGVAPHAKGSNRAVKCLSAVGCGSTIRRPTSSLARAATAVTTSMT
jgi:hypothetical protein